MFDLAVYYIFTYIKCWRRVRWNNQDWISMDLSSPCVRVHMLYDAKRGLKAAKAAGCIRSAFDNDIVFDHTARDCFVRFHTPSHDVEDWPCPVRSSAFSEEPLRHLVEENSQQKHVTLQNLCGYHNQPWFSTWGNLALCPTCQVGTVQAAWGAAPDSCRWSGLATLSSAYQDLAQLKIVTGEEKEFCMPVLSPNGRGVHPGTTRKC